LEGRLRVGLCDVETVDDPEAPEHTLWGILSVLLVAPRPIDAGREEGDARSPLRTAAAKLEPGVETRDRGGLGSCRAISIVLEKLYR
jgi:hypothetical protein